MFGRIFLWLHLVLGFLFAGGFWLLNISLLFIGLFRFSISSWFSLIDCTFLKMYLFLLLFFAYNYLCSAYDPMYISVVSVVIYPLLFPFSILCSLYFIIFNSDFKSKILIIYCFEEMFVCLFLIFSLYFFLHHLSPYILFHLHYLLTLLPHNHHTVVCLHGFFLLCFSFQLV